MPLITAALVVTVTFPSVVLAGAGPVDRVDPLASFEVHGTTPQCLRLIEGVFDPRGDERYMPYLNEERVLLRNECGTPRGLDGWIIHDYARTATYRFPYRSSIAAGAMLRLRTGAGVDTSTDRYWGRGAPVWDNATWERAYLRDPAGALSSTWTRADRRLVGAGDIASCTSGGDEATAKLLDANSGTVFTTGDNAYRNGTADEFSACYVPSWGRHKWRTRPAPGNHDYYTSGAAGYYGYFGWRAGSPSRGYYSYERGAWHVVVLNSNCSAVGGCGKGSPQEQWLRADLLAHPARCTLAYWHAPRFSSGPHGSDSLYQALWQALYDHRAELVLNGHDHAYERFAPQTASGSLDRTRGIREIVVGTGGASSYAFESVERNSEVRGSSTFGVLRLTLRPQGYDWKFLPVAGKTFTDSGSTSCH